MSRRLIPWVEPVNNASAGPHLYPATANVRFTERFAAHRAPDAPRAGDFNTRPSRRKFFHGGNSLSLFILREGFERATERQGFPRQVAMATGQMLPFRNPTGNSRPTGRLSWGTFLDRYAADTGRTAWTTPSPS